MLKSGIFKKELATARKAAFEAGKILTHMFGNVTNITKKGDIDLVTDADLQAENAILKEVRNNFPKDNILSEEAGKDGVTSKRTWLIDPLDGTTNFAHGFSFFSISIALEVEDETVLGLVHIPVMGEVFEAVKGMGAYFNNHSIKVSKTPTLIESLLATGFPYDVHEKADEIMKFFKKMIVKAQGIRRPGSAAVDLCYTAAGIFDGFWEQGLKPWDTAAGAIIAREAGAKVTEFSGAPHSPYSKNIVASNPSIYEEMIRVLNG